MANCAATKQFGTVVIFLLILIHWGWCKDDNCDVNHCKSLFPTIFKEFFKKGTQRLCRSSDDTIECINKCLQMFFPDFGFVNSKTFITSEVCSYDIAYEVLDCPYEILHDCDEDAIEIVSKLFSNVFKASMESACHLIPLNAVYDLPVTYSLNNSYLNTAACLDNLPSVTSNCFPQHIQNFDVNELYHCRINCEKLDGGTCLPSSLMSDFYIPVLSLGKYSCAKDSTVEDTVQMQESSKSSPVTYNSDISSKVNSEASTTIRSDENDYYIPSDEAKNDVFLSDYNTVEASTLSYPMKIKEMGHVKVQSTIHSPGMNISMTSKKHPENDSILSDNAAASSIESNGAYKLE
ncbi:hypothetical protein HNY73_012344 [Argiope bruennichi]|uniref:Uncharacterized protein n=1 Tax=Argiope bruennichi TaxID=94029 RepID=A0A8T0EWP6_ARGBR|nr:hypothetical protein HNY73_012344 [Argiope bruennichi]